MRSKGDSGQFQVSGVGWTAGSIHGVNVRICGGKKGGREVGSEEHRNIGCKNARGKRVVRAPKSAHWSAGTDAADFVM